MTSMPPEPPSGDQPGYGAPPPPPGYGTPPPPPGYGAPTEPGFGGMSSIPAPPGQWAGPPLAEWPQRVLAGLIDGAIVAVPYLILIRMSVGLALLVNLGLTVYLQHMQGTTGQTPGKKVIGLRLLREADGQVLGFPAAIGRYILHLIDAAACFVGYLWPIWDAKRQTFADKIIGSVVIRG